MNRLEKEAFKVLRRLSSGQSVQIIWNLPVLLMELSSNEKLVYIHKYIPTEWKLDEKSDIIIINNNTPCTLPLYIFSMFAFLLFPCSFRLPWSFHSAFFWFYNLLCFFLVSAFFSFQKEKGKLQFLVILFLFFPQEINFCFYLCMQYFV